MRSLSALQGERPPDVLLCSEDRKHDSTHAKNSSGKSLQYATRKVSRQIKRAVNRVGGNISRIHRFKIFTCFHHICIIFLTYIYQVLFVDRHLISRKKKGT